jgi:carbon starvation protein
LSPAIVACLALVAYFFGYSIYSKWLANRVFRLNAESTTPAHEFEDGVDFVPTSPLVLFGHHYASIAGLAPMLGPAVAVFWGWLPALAWLVLGAIFIGCVHDFAALVLSARHKGKSIGALCEDILGKQAKYLFLLLITFGVSLAMGVFVFIISLLFSWGDDFKPDQLSASTTSFPEVVMPSAGLMIIALICGWLLNRKKVPLLYVTLGGFSALLGMIALGYQIPTMGLSKESWPTTNSWTWILMAYAFIASVVPVWLLLQTRDFLNSLLLGLGLLMMYSGFFIQSPTFDAPAINANPVGAPPILPFVFITIACGAASGFHSLVASGTTARQLNNELDARPIGYGGMIAESLLGLIAILACTTTLGSSTAWAKLYVNWNAVADSLAAKLGVFIQGSASFISELGVSHELAVTLVAMVVVSFALTTLDSATRLLRFNLEELGIRNRYLATLIGCGFICFFAFYKIDGKPAGLSLWTLFGATNQMIAGLALLTATAYLRQLKRPAWPLALPAFFMILMTLFGLFAKIQIFSSESQWLLFGLAIALILVGLGVAFTAIRSIFKPNS